MFGTLRTISEMYCFILSLTHARHRDKAAITLVIPFIVIFREKVLR